MSLDQDQEVDYNRLWWAGPVAVGAAVLANAIVYKLAYALGAMPKSAKVKKINEPITLLPVVISTTVNGTGGVLVFALTGWFAKQPLSLFRAISLGVLILSFASPLLVKKPPFAMVVVLELLHIVAAIVSIEFLLNFATKRKD